jgi:hypothetical protein
MTPTWLISITFVVPAGAGGRLARPALWRVRKRGLADSVDSASPHETKLVGEALAGSFLNELPARLIGDRAYDSHPLDRRLEREYGIELIAPSRENRSQTQDGRKLRRYQRRWCVERWCLVAMVPATGHALPISIENFLGMVRLGCMRVRLCYLCAITRVATPASGRWKPRAGLE